MTGQDYMDEQVTQHREACDVVAALINERGDDDVTGVMVSDVLATAGFHLVAFMLPPSVLFQETYCKGEA